MVGDANYPRPDAKWPLPKIGDGLYCSRYSQCQNSTKFFGPPAWG